MPKLNSLAECLFSSPTAKRKQQRANSEAQTFKERSRIKRMIKLNP